MNKTVEYLYPEVSNLYGDPFNVKFLQKCIEKSGFNVEVNKDSLNAEPYFAKSRPDLIYMGPMTEHSQELVIAKLLPYKDRIRELIDDGVVFLITGNAVEIFEEKIECEDGTQIQALNLYPFKAVRKMFARYNSLFLGEFEGCKIVANKSQFSHSYGDTKAYPFIKVTRGDGFCPGEAFEGIMDKNFMGTYLLGPILILNPDFTKHVLAKMGIETPVLSFEKEAYKAYDIRLKEFENENTEYKS